MSKKTFALVATTTAAVLAGSGIAVAYWTTTGSGTGSATAGTTSVLTVAQTSSPAGLYPGGPASQLDISVTNPGTAAARITTLTATPTSTDKPGCNAADFDVQVTGIAATTIAPGATTPFTNVGTVALTETGVNQDACKGAVVTISYSVS